MHIPLLSYIHDFNHALLIQRLTGIPSQECIIGLPLSLPFDATVIKRTPPGFRRTFQLLRIRLVQGHVRHIIYYICIGPGWQGCLRTRTILLSRRLPTIRIQRLPCRRTIARLRKPHLQQGLVADRAVVIGYSPVQHPEAAVRSLEIVEIPYLAKREIPAFIDFHHGFGKKVETVASHPTLRGRTLIYIGKEAVQFETIMIQRVFGRCRRSREPRISPKPARRLLPEQGIVKSIGRKHNRLNPRMTDGWSGRGWGGAAAKGSCRSGCLVRSQGRGLAQGSVRRMDGNDTKGQSQGQQS